MIFGWLELLYTPQLSNNKFMKDIDKSDKWPVAFIIH